jgi:tetratricopeptide (TPR) repeat protein
MEPDDADLARFAAARYPDKAEAHFWLGNALTKAGDKAGAIQAFEKGLALQPDAQVWVELGRLYQSRDDYERAAAAYDQACLLKDMQANGCSGAGDLYLKMGKYEQAARSFQASIDQISYTWIPSEEGLVTALMALNRTEEAIPHLRVLADNGSTEARQTLERLGQAGK